MKRPQFLRLPLLAVLLLTACSFPLPTIEPSAAPQLEEVPTFTLPPASPTLSPSPQPTTTPSPEPSLTSTPAPSNTPTPEPTFTPTFVPTYVKLRGKVIIEQAVCHYGPGAPYLYKYGVYQGSNLEVLRRVDGGNYIEVQAIGGNNPCWVRQDYMELKGDLSWLQPVSAEDVVLPSSPYYPPPTGATALRDGNTVTVSWDFLELRAGDDSEQMSYIVEAWVCQGGQFVFSPLGTRITSLTITDETGCAQKSHARLLAAEKHGYTKWVEIPWPAHPSSNKPPCKCN